MANIPTISLKTVPLQYTAFTPEEFVPQTSDPTLLSQAAKDQEQREREANAYFAAINDTLEKKTLGLNTADYGWMAELANNTRRDVEKQLELGNWQSALRLARKAANDLSKNTELAYRIKANEKYTEERNKIQSGSYSDLTKRRWDDLNKYKFNHTPDWTPEFRPVNDVSVADIWAMAVNKARINRSSSSSKRTSNSHNYTNAKGDIINKATERYTNPDGTQGIRVADGVTGTYSTTQVTKGGGRSTESKTISDIMNIFNDLLKDGNVRASLKQQYNNYLWLLDHAKAIKDDPNASDTAKKQAEEDIDRAENALSDKDGFTYSGEKDFEAWVQAQAKQYAKDSAYTHTSTSSESSVTSGVNDTTIGQIYGFRQETYKGMLMMHGDATSEGASIARSVTDTSPSYSAKDDADLIGQGSYTGLPGTK